MIFSIVVSMYRPNVTSYWYSRRENILSFSVEVSMICQLFQAWRIWAASETLTLAPTQNTRSTRATWNPIFPKSDYF